MQGIWILERCANDRFPYRLQILKGDRRWLVLRTQDRWPAAGRHIFYLREEEPPDLDEVIEELEKVDIVAFNERGRRLRREGRAKVKRKRRRPRRYDGAVVSALRVVCRVPTVVRLAGFSAGMGYIMGLGIP